jgi:DNA-binding winged helix-turn-helix (wHTH) protein/Tfp pilus assembly protein PilF
MDFPQSVSGVVRFGVFEANLRAGELRRSGIKVRIQEMPFRALIVLLKRPGEVIGREELRLALWPEGVFVDFDQGISSAIRRLRDALGDSADNPVFIETVERRGYRWIAPMRLAEAVPQGNGGRREEARTEAPLPPRSSPWRKVVFALPLLALLFATWIFRPGFRNAKAGAKSGPAAWAGGLHHAANREAEDYYLQGRFYWNKRTPESLGQAVDSFTQAIVHDPTYSDAYVGLADCYNLLREYTMMPANEAYPRALAAAKKAVELNDRSSQAHASLAFVSFNGMWDSGMADEEFRRAIDLDPNNSNAHHWYATFLLSVRRLDESLNEIDRAHRTHRGGTAPSATTRGSRSGFPFSAPPLEIRLPRNERLSRLPCRNEKGSIPAPRRLTFGHRDGRGKRLRRPWRNRNVRRPTRAAEQGLQPGKAFPLLSS